jgi:murein DD-endopeptidase MepM/ murein hydrolase activator NlpD
MKQSSAGMVLVAGLAFLLLLVITPVILFMGASSDDDTTAHTAQGCSPSGSGDVGLPSEYLPFVEDAAKESGLPVSLLSSLYYHESGFDPNAVSPVGAGGFAQFMPETWAEWGNGKERFNAQASIEASGRYLGHLHDMIAPLASTDQERIELTLAAYNAGPGNVQRYGGIPPFPETQAYVPNILEHAQLEFSEDCTQPGGSTIGDLGSGEWTHPLPGGRFTSGYGPRPCPAGTQCNEYVANHHGIDFATGGGAQIVAPTDMQVTATGTNQYQGEYVIGRMTEDPGLVFQFHHCQSGSTSVTTGSTVAVGTGLCIEGNTGNTSGGANSGHHLHFQINLSGADDTKPTYTHTTDPQPILIERGIL